MYISKKKLVSRYLWIAFFFIKKANNMKNDKLIDKKVLEIKLGNVLGFYFTVNFIENQEEKYIECKKIGFFMDVKDFASGKKGFSLEINNSIIKAINSNKFYTLMEEWNLKLTDVPKIMVQKTKEIRKFKDSAEINKVNALMLSSAMIARERQAQLELIKF